MNDEKQIIVRYVQQQGTAHFATLMRHLELPASRKTALRRLLREMEREGTIVRGGGKQYRLPVDKAVLQGRISLAEGGYGFVAVTGEEGFDVFVPRHKLGGACNGDVVKVREDWRQKGRRSGTVVAIVERGVKRLQGELQAGRAGFYVRGEAAGIPGRVIIPDDALGGARDGDRVGVELTEYPEESGGRDFVGRVVEVFRDDGGIGTTISAIVFEKALRDAFPEDVLEEAGRLGAEPSERDLEGRVDLRALPFVTIDGDDARDFDDAVCLVEEGGRRSVWVAIADVSHYVRWGSPLDREARARGTSTYFPMRVLPMLPEALSNHLCSLRPDVDRLALAVEMVLGEGGQVQRHRIVEAVIRSRARLTYSQVQRLLDGEAADDQPPASGLRPMLLALAGISAALLRARVAAGALDLEIPEPQFVLSDDGLRVDAVISRTRTGATSLIEELMLLCNRVVAKDFVARELPSVFRIHEPPDPEKVAAFMRVARMFVPEMTAKDPKGARELQQIVEAVTDKPVAAILQGQLLRAMMRARYAAECLGHYGLAFDEYLHFTSPIRRYPDLVVHRLTRRFLVEGAEKGTPSGRLARELERIADESSVAERRSTDAEREVDDMLKAAYMEGRVGETMNGVVSGVTQTGLFITLEGLPIEGLLRTSELQSDDYQLDTRRQRLVARYSGSSVGLGDAMRVVIAGADRRTRHIDLLLAGKEPRAERPAPRRREVPARPTARPAGRRTGRPKGRSRR